MKKVQLVCIFVQSTVVSNKMLVSDVLYQIKSGAGSQWRESKNTGEVARGASKPLICYLMCIPYSA